MYEQTDKQKEMTQRASVKVREKSQVRKQMEIVL